MKNKNKNKNHKNATTRCVTSCGMKRTSYCALHLCARAEYMNNTYAQTTIHNPYGIAGVRSSTTKYSYDIYNSLPKMSRKMLITEFAKWANPFPVREKSHCAGWRSLSSFQQRNMMPPFGSKIISKRKLPCPSTRCKTLIPVPW